jgi:hypothetical protein
LAELPGPEATRLSDLTAQQWKSGLAAWLGWLFDGLDMHLYVLVAGPFVAELLGVAEQKDPAVGYYSSLIQAAFLIGWTLRCSSGWPPVSQGKVNIAWHCSSRVFCSFRRRRSPG